MVEPHLAREGQRGSAACTLRGREEELLLHSDVAQQPASECLERVCVDRGAAIGGVEQPSELGVVAAEAFLDRSERHGERVPRPAFFVEHTT